MGRRARLHRHHARRQLGEELRQRPAPELAREDDLALRVDAVKLEDVLRQIKTNARDGAEFRIELSMDGFPSDGLMTTTILAR